MTSMRATTLGLLVLGACTQAEVPSPEPSHEVPVPEPELALLEVTPEASSAMTADVAQAGLAPSDEPWHWLHRAPRWLAGGMLGVGFAPIADHRIEGAPRRFVAERRGDRIELRREDLAGPSSETVAGVAWTRDFAAPRSGEVVLLVGLGSTDVVAGHRTDEGYALRRYSQDGTLRWQVTARDPEPTTPSEALALQLGMGRECLLVYNRGASGAFLDEVDFETGEPRARGHFDASVLHERFPWPPEGAARGRRLGHRWPAEDGGVYRVARQAKALVVEREHPGGGQAWRATVDADGGGWWSSAAFVELADAVVVVLYHGASSGAVAHGLSRRDGAVRFHASPGSIGSIGHSKYSNELAVSASPSGHVLTFGRESGGRYIGVLDVDAGRLLGCEVWRD